MKNTSVLVSNELRAIRSRLDLTIEEVANKTKINKDTISRYENNKSALNLDIIEKLLKFYNVDFNIFFTTIYANTHNN